MFASIYRDDIFNLIRCMVNVDTEQSNSINKTTIRCSSEDKKYKQCKDYINNLEKLIKVKFKDDINVTREYIDVDILKLLIFILPEEFLNVQSIYLQENIKNYWGSYQRGEDTNKFFSPSPSIDDVKKYSNEYKAKNRRKKGIDPTLVYPDVENIERDSFEYNKILDYKTFELNNNFAFEFAKRRYPVLYISEYLHNVRIVEDFFEYVMQLKTTSFINERKLIEWSLNINIFKNLVNDLLDNINEEKSFYNVFEKFFKIEKYKLTDKEYEQRYEDFPLKDATSFPLDKNYMTRIIPKFRLPKLTIALKWEVDIRVNLAWTDEQILDFISHVKEKSATKLNMLENNIYNNEKILNDDMELVKKYHADIRSNNDIREIVADILFTHDCLQMKLSHNFIAGKLNDYYIIKEQNSFSELSNKDQYIYLNYSKKEKESFYKLSNIKQDKELESQKEYSDFLELSEDEKLDKVEDKTYKTSMADLITAYAKVALDRIEGENFMLLINP